MSGDELRQHRRGEGVSSYLCSYCCQPWPCPEVERHTYGPAAPTADVRDDVREQIARAVGEAWITSGPRAWDQQSEGRRAGARHLADALLPVVERYAAQRATEALRAAADEVEHAPVWADWLRARADALAPEGKP